MNRKSLLSAVWLGLVLIYLVGSAALAQEAPATPVYTDVHDFNGGGGIPRIFRRPSQCKAAMGPSMRNRAPEGRAVRAPRPPCLHDGDRWHNPELYRHKRCKRTGRHDAGHRWPALREYFQRGHDR